MSVKIDRYCASVVQAYDKPRNKLKHTRKRFFNKKSLRGAKRVKQLINYLYETSTKNYHRMYFVTITTMQHRTGKSDLQLSADLRKWFKNRGPEFQYVCVLERQRVTEDVHYHIVIRNTVDFDIKRECNKLGKLLGTNSHPALFDVKKLTNIRTVISYINKYVTKGCNPLACRPIKEGEKPQYSSIFYCRTFNASRGLTKSYRENAHQSVITIGNDDLESYKHLFVEKFKSEYFRTFIYNSDIWALARHLYELERFHRLY